jgi:hypothetical protein
MAKKTRRRSAPTSQSQKPTKKRPSRNKQTDEIEIPTLEERELQAEKIRNVTPKVYQSVNWDRLNNMPDYTEKSKPNRISNLYATYDNMSKAQLEAVLKDPNKTIGEIRVLMTMKASLDEKNKDRMTVQKYIDERIEGKVKQTVEYTGNINQKMEYQTKEIPDFDAMTKEQRRAYRQALEAVHHLPTKSVKVEDES